MRTLLKKARAAGLAALWLLTPSVLIAQGTSPWVDAVAELERQFTGPIARRPSVRPASARWAVRRVAPAANRSLAAGPQRGARRHRARRWLAATV